MAELNEHFCMICGTTKNDPKSITCGHPKCINIVLECIGNEGEFISVARENGIDNPEKLKEYLEKMEKLKNMISEIRISLYKNNPVGLRSALISVKSLIEELY